MTAVPIFIDFTEKLHVISDCCSHVLVQYANNETKVYRAIEEYGQINADIFIVFERENGTTNGRDHYKSLDGKHSIDYNVCGDWGIRNYEDRYSLNSSYTAEFCFFLLSLFGDKFKKDILPISMPEIYYVV